MAARATAAPARPIRTSTGSGAARSIAAISSGVTTGITAPLSYSAGAPSSYVGRSRRAVIDQASVTATTVTVGAKKLLLTSSDLPVDREAILAPATKNPAGALFAS